MKTQISYIIYEVKKGKILSIFTPYNLEMGDFPKLTKQEVFSMLRDMIPEPDKTDLIVMTGELDRVSGMRVNPKSKKLEKVKRKKK